MIKKTTETSSLYNELEKMSTLDLLRNINREDHKVPEVIARILPQIERVVEAVYEKMKEGGRLFYMGSGTSGRLGVVDASECPPTFGVPHGWVIGLISGGDSAIRKAVEFAEDSREMGWSDLQAHKANAGDFVIGITASGTTPYVLGAMEKAREHGIQTAGITCNEGAPLSEAVDFPIVAVVGPEFVTGSTRMKAGTAQKLILNMISTSVMIKLGRVKGNKMVDMQLANNKLVDRGTRMLVEELGLPYEEAKELLLEHGSVRLAIESKN
ncbi:MAG: N-acetylmuramic acid 6-phosphate etherase [Bacteroidia bacterium]|nr:N-acetylmuramic acid 6-phosphate etherase [Bacteroidia bacterium]